MSDWRFWIPLAVSIAVVVVFPVVLWVNYSHRPKYPEGTKEHSERVYRDFEFFVKIFIALVGAVGYLRFKEFGTAPLLARQGMKGVGLLGLLTMSTLTLFISCHQGSKIRRWVKVEWGTVVFWQETWMIVSMCTMAVLLWFAAWLW